MGRREQKVKVVLDCENIKELTELFITKDYAYVNELKDRNRGMILLLIKKIKETKNLRFIPILEEWKKIEYKKVAEAIQKAINYLKINVSIY